jgi:putative addiction module component (TIGR02574 family)
MTLQQVQKSALKLPLPSRVRLMSALAKSFETEVIHVCPPGVLSDSDPNFMEILQARMDAYDRGEIEAIPWETVKKRLFKTSNGNKAPSRSRVRAKKSAR